MSLRSEMRSCLVLRWSLQLVAVPHAPSKRRGPCVAIIAYEETVASLLRHVSKLSEILALVPSCESFLARNSSRKPPKIPMKYSHVNDTSDVILSFGCVCVLNGT